MGDGYFMKKWKSIFATVIAVCICFGATGCGESKSKSIDDLTDSDIEKAVSELDSYEKTTLETEVNANEINPFDYLIITYTGIAPRGQVSLEIDWSNTPTNYLSFTANKTDGVSNGEKITVTAKCIDEDYSLTETSREYTVEGLDAYATTLEDIPDEMKEKMLKQANDSITASCASWAEGNSLKGLEFLGYYFLTGKLGFSPSPYNEIYCVYKVKADITGSKKDFADKQVECGEEFYYTFYRYSDVMILKDGTCSVNLSDGQLPSDSEKTPTEHGYWSGDNFSSYVFTGYKDLDSMFNSCITKNIDKYEYETTVK